MRVKFTRNGAGSSPIVLILLTLAAPAGRWSPSSVPITDGRNHNNKSVTGRKGKGDGWWAVGRFGGKSSPYLIDDDE